MVGSESMARRSGGDAAPRTLALVALASGLVLLLAVLVSFRLGLAEDLPTLSRVNGPRVLFAAACGGLVALGGALRLEVGRVRPLFELELFAAAAGAAGAGFLAAGAREGGAALAAFALGATLGGVAGAGLARALDRPARWTNLAAAAILVAGIAAAALAGTYARARRDDVSGAVSWLLGDLAGASFASGGALASLLAALALAASRRDTARGTIALLATAIAFGAAGPLVFVGTMVPRAVRALARGASAQAVRPASVLAGGATVAAIDAAPRLLVGGYDFPFAVPAAMLAIPIFLGWNRARLRREIGPAHVAFEALELALLVALTLGGAFFAWTLAKVIHTVT
jgi:iron complex transport system permease protein